MSYRMMDEKKTRDEFKKAFCKMIDECDHFSFNVTNETIEIPFEFHSRQVLSGWQTIEARFFNPGIIHR